MAGAGRRTFTPGEVLTASNVMNYLQDQAVMNFAGTAARGSAIGTAVSEGMVSYLADTNVVQAYDGSAWNSLAYATAVPTNAQNGLKPIIPTVTVSAGTATVDSTTGLITMTNAQNLNATGLFNLGYKRVRVVSSFLTVGGLSEIYAWFTNSGTNITTGWYGGAHIVYYTGTTGAVNVRNNGNGGWISHSSTSEPSTIDYDLYVDSALSRVSYSGITFMRGIGATCYGGYGTNGASDGFRITPAAGGYGITGTMKFYGYN